MKVSDYRFPQGFLWGCASSAYQIEGAPREGGKGESIWDRFSRLPGKTANGATGDLACDFYHRFGEDLDLARGLGIGAYRFSTSWTRIQPEGRGEPLAAGLDFYDRVVDACLSRGIEPWPCLFHYDLPQALEDRGGWPARETALRFAEYAGHVARRLGDRVPAIMTHNEPWVAAILGYGLGEHAPGRADPGAAVRALHHMLLSHGLAYDAIKASAKNEVKVGITLNLSPVHPATGSPADRGAAARMDALQNRATLDPLLLGTTPLKSWIFGAGSLLTKLATALVEKPGDAERIRRLDILGINYYTRSVVRHDPKTPVIAADEARLEGVERSEMWEIYPAGMGELLDRVWRDYHPSCDIYVTENGVPVPESPEADGSVRDAGRISYLDRHLAEVAGAMERGVPVKGYFHWSLTDNFEWALGYGPRFGLVRVDYQSQERTPKDSYRWFAELIARNGRPSRT